MNEPRPAQLMANSRARVCLMLATFLIAGSCSGGGGKDASPTSPAPVTPVLTTITVSLSATTIQVGQTATTSAAGLDQNGASIGLGTVTWSTGSTSVATVSATGAVSGVAPGQVAIIASAGGRTGQQSLTVIPVPVASVSVTPAAATLAVGATQQLAASTLDAGGNALAGRAITWATTDSTTVKVSPAGLATAVAAGIASITATSEGKSGTAVITVSPPPATSVTIASIAPATLTPGTTATIGGTGFNPTPAQNTVTIDGVAAVVTAATPAQLVVTVPTALPCAPTHAATVRVTTGGASASATQTLRAGTLRSLAVGSSVVITGAGELACTELPAGSARYAINVVNVSQSPTTVTPYRLRGSVSVPAVASLADRSARPSTAVSIRRSQAAALAPRALPEGVGPLPTDPDMHSRLLEMNRRMYPTALAAFQARKQRLASARLRRDDVTAPFAGPALAATTVGSTRKFRVNQFTVTLNSTGSCASFKEITAKAVYVGTRSIVWEDVAAPLAGTMDSYFVRLGQEFDATMYPSDATYFGDPLVTDPDTDADQHLDMVFTPSIPTGVAGFVISCDFFQRDSTVNPSSNFGEFFYAVVPTVAGSGFGSSGTADSWMRSIRTTIVHEVKHIASFGAHLENNASTFEESWLEEGMARHAEEVWLRNNVYHVAWKGNTAYSASLYCDVRPTFPECLGAPYGIFKHFQTLYSFLNSPDTYSLFGRVADGDFNFYATSWSFVRWAADRYAASEVAFLTAITHSVNASGTANIAARTGRPVDEMLANWSLSFYLDENAAFNGNADVAFPTWNTRNIYASMTADFPSTFTQSFPLAADVVTKGNFVIDDAGFHAGSFQLFDLSGTSLTGQTLGIVGYQGAGPASTSLRIAIARIQ